MIKHGKKPIRLLLGIIVISCLTTYSGCIPECGSNAEPSAEIYFQNPKNYTSVYGLKETVQEIPSYSTNYWVVPLSLKEGKTTIIFTSITDSDTLTLQYDKVVKMKSVRCGFHITFKDFEIIQPTTFKDLQVTPILDPESRQIYVEIND